jgi:hypothetical protein
MENRINSKQFSPSKEQPNTLYVFAEKSSGSDDSEQNMVKRNNN